MTCNQRQLLALPTGVLSLEIALGLVPAASTADSESVKEFETDIKSSRAVFKIEGWGAKLPQCWATFLTSACLSLHELGIIITRSILIIHSSYILSSHHKH